MQRKHSLDQLANHGRWDLAIIGGGATGMGIAVDAASRGFSVLLCERGDFGQGTSSRSTKLIHGGVRYLRQGNLSLVRESLNERRLLMLNAPHLVHRCEFLVPSYSWRDTAYYGMGLKLYSLMAGRQGLGGSRMLSRDETLRRVPTLVQRGLRGGVSYADGQFDDARLLIALARTALAHGACILNYAPVVSLGKSSSGVLQELTFRDELSGTEHSISARCIINAAGPFSDAVRQLDDPHQAPLLAASQGAHIVLPRRFLPGETAVLLPHTRDGRVLFAIPWLGHTIIGTTETPMAEAVRDPCPFAQEIDYLLETSAGILETPPARTDILSVFAGIRPLVCEARQQNTAKMSREHIIQASHSGLLTVTGGKWTTYRLMAEQAVDEAIQLSGLPSWPCQTRDLPLHGFHSSADEFGEYKAYGADAPAVRQLSESHLDWAEPLDPRLPVTGAQIAWAARFEMALTLEDVLARRTRALFLNARAALDMAPRVVAILAAELGRGADWIETQLQAFRATAEQYLPADTDFASG